jgi:hypothetical protein
MEIDRTATYLETTITASAERANQRLQQENANIQLSTPTFAQGSANNMVVVYNILAPKDYYQKVGQVICEYNINSRGTEARGLKSFVRTSYDLNTDPSIYVPNTLLLNICVQSAPID